MTVPWSFELNWSLICCLKWLLCVSLDSQWFSIADLLVVEPHTPRGDPVKYNKKDGQWYTHDGVDVKETQSRRGEYILNCVANKKPTNNDWLQLD